MRAMLLWIGVLAITIGACIASAADSPAYNPTTRTVSNWREQANEHLGVSGSALERHGYLRCIRLNNYWCLKDMGWKGGLGRDKDRHTAFVNGDMAARAAVRNFRTAYVTRKRRTAEQILAVYAPAADCVGSEAARRADGTCAEGYNNVEQYSALLAQGVTTNGKADLELFDEQGRADVARMTRFLQNMSSYEIGGLRVSAATIQRGICLERAGTCTESSAGLAEEKKK